MPTWASRWVLVPERPEPSQLVLLDSQFSVLPKVVAEGRRVLGNIERVSDLFLTKVLLFGAAFVDHCRVDPDVDLQSGVHLPAASPDSDYVVDDRNSRVLPCIDAQHPTVQAGILQACLALLGVNGRDLRVFSFTTYLLVLTEDKPVEDARTAAAITLFIIAWVVLILVARPLNALRIGIVVVMGFGFLTVIGLPTLSKFFALNLSTDNDGLTAVAVGVVGAGVLIGVRKLIESRTAGDPQPARVSTDSAS